MERRSIRRTVVAVGLTVVFLIAACAIVAFFAFGGNLKEVSVPSYVITTRVGDRFDFTLDLDRMIWEQHLPSPPDGELQSYPEIAAIRSLGLYVQRDENGYHFETTSTSSDPDFLRALRKAGIVLKNTQWTWTETDIIGRNATQPNDGFTVLQLSDFVRVQASADGAYTATVDHDALLSACKFDLPPDPNTHSGYTAIMSLSVGCSPADGAYRLQAQSTLPTIMEQLAENRVRIAGTSWTWTAEEMASRAGAPAQTAASANAGQASQNAQTEDPSAAGAPDAEASATDAPAETGRKEGITSLYGFDQTAVRTAIRNAKEAYYGSKFESGSVYANLFAVGTAQTPHSNCFRIVYEITTTGGTEYLIADVYDLASESGYTASDVTLKTAASRSEARANEDLADYTLYPLNGGSMVFAENANKSPFDADGLVKEKSIRESLSYDELWDIPQTADWTLLQLLAFARNEMFARAGHAFDTSGSYYRHFSSCAWYEPVGSVSANELGTKWPATAGNITTIKFLEKLIKEG